jgi:predicted ester cyclase
MPPRAICSYLSALSCAALGRVVNYRPYPLSKLPKGVQMSVEQVAREFVTKMTDEATVRSLMAPNAMASGGVLPQAIPMTEAIKTSAALAAAFPDIKFDIQQVTVSGNQATVKAQWSGTNTGPLAFPFPGMPSIPPTGKKVSVKDAYVVTVEGDKVTHMRVDSPSDGGVPAAMAQMGVKMPGM